MTEQTKPGLPRGLASTAADRDAIATLMCDELEKGLSIRVACDKVGVTLAWYERWKKKAEQGNEEAIGLMRKLKAARARGFDEHRGKIKLAADEGDWRAAAWLINKLYPNWVGQVEEIVYTPQEEDGDSLTKQYNHPDRLRELAEMVEELGLCKHGLELARLQSGQQVPVQRPSNPAQPPQDPLVPIMQAAWAALAAGERYKDELTSTLCAAFRCQPEVVQEALNRIGCQVLDGGSPGRRPRLKLPEQQRPSPAVEPPASTDVRTGNPGSEAGDGRSGSWLGGEAGTGVGDMIARRRG